MLKILFTMILSAMLPMTVCAQRIQQKLDRSVVAVTNEAAGSSVLVSWRRLAQEPEDCTYNIYTRAKGGMEYTKLNAEPIASTNYTTSRSAVPYNTEVAVTIVTGGKESEKSRPFLFKKQTWRNIFFDIDFETAVLTPDNYKASCAWPMDLDGNGEYDAILVNRMYEGGHGDDPGCADALYPASHKLQAYTLDGKCLWTVDMGPNVPITTGQTDMVTTYDIDCDGRCEVILKSSDGTRFWNHSAGTWGKYAAGSAVADTDADGIANYRSQTKRNPPFYISILNAATGEEETWAELKYNEINDGADSYSRDNRANYADDADGTEYAFLGCKFAVGCFDGIHPSLGVQCYLRNKDKAFHYYMLDWTFDWTGGKPSNWHHNKTWSFRRDSDGAAEFHQLRVADVDGDGIDEVVDGGFSWNPVKGQVAKPRIGHGDRFDLSDIDPDRPGLEVFAIQQTNLLGQLIYDAATGEHIKEWFLPTIGDVGRGRCMDVDAAHKGYEVFSTMANLYDCKGNVIKEGDTPFPHEAIWWDGDLQREQLSSSGSSGYDSNVLIEKYSEQRIFQIARETDWTVHSGWANRPPFVGDMTGDWREEVILAKQNSTSSKGLVGFSTEIPTAYSMYTLQEDPHYRLDCNTRGYYQSPNTGFYLGGDMPYPPLPAVMTTDCRWKGGAKWSAASSADNFLSFDMTTAKGFVDGDSFVFDISGDNSQPITIEGVIKPSKVYVMNPKDHDYTFAGGSLAGDMELWKSMQGTATFNGNLDYTGKTVVSEGTLCLNGKVAGPVELRAKGTLAGCGTLSGNITFEGALNYEGCRIMPGSDADKYAALTFGRSLTLPGNVYIEINAGNGQNGKLVVNGDLTLEGINTITIARSMESLAEGRYIIAECTGTLTADAKSIKTRGLDGVNSDVTVEDKQIVLTIHGSRAPQKGVVWSGNESNIWDYKTNNFLFNGRATPFVTGDEVAFTDASGNRNITVNDVLQPAAMVFDFNEGTYTLSGSGSIGGSGGLTKNGKGELKMNLTANSFTGPLVLNDGTLTVEALADGGKESTIGAAAADEGNFQLNGGTLKITSVNMATDRILTIGDTMEINVSKSNAAISLKGKVKGTGMIVKKGLGQLNLTYGGVNPFGGMIVKEGKVAIGAWNTTFGRVGSPLVLAGGTVDLLDVNSTSTMPTLNHAVTVVEGTKSTIMGTSRGTIAGSIEGKGTLTIETVYVRNDISADFSKFEGTLIAASTDGNFRLMDGVKDMKKTRLKIDAGTYVGHYKAGGSNERAITTQIGSVESTATDCALGHASDSYEVGYNGVNTTYKGKLAAKLITKYGAGKWTLSGSESTSPITVKAGTLYLNNNPYSSTLTPATTGLITVASGARLEGRGCAAAVVVKNGGVIAAADSTTAGTLKASGTVTMESGSTMEINVCHSSTGALSKDAFKFSGTLTLQDATLLVIVAPEVVMKAGDAYQIFIGTGTVSGTFTLKTQSLGRKITWDTSTLLTDGTLRVVEVENTVGIDDVTVDDKDLRQPFTTVGGVHVEKPAKGLYIHGGKKVIVK